LGPSTFFLTLLEFLFSVNPSAECGLYDQQFEILNYRHNWGEYRVTFYEKPGQVRALPAAWTSMAPPDPDVVLAAGRAAFRVRDLLALTQLIQRIEDRKEDPEC
jgi:Family of unknown function (DUF5372)